MSLVQLNALHWAAATATILCFVMSLTDVTAIATDHSHKVVTMFDHEPRFRVRRQTSHRNRGFFSLVSEFISETRNDTRRAFREISDLVTRQISPVPQGLQLNDTGPINRELPDDDDTPTTAAPYVISQDEFLKILRRNLRGLAKLFNTESRKALQDSNNNVREARKQFMDVVRPYVVTNSTASNA